jgi:hypothetical protein
MSSTRGSRAISTNDRYELTKLLERIDSGRDAKLDVKRSERRRIGLRSQKTFRVETLTAKIRKCWITKSLKRPIGACNP